MNEWHEAEDRIEKARAFFEQQRWHEALAELRAAIDQDPYNANWLFNVGLTLDELQRFDEAVEAYRRSLEIEPCDIQTMNHLGVDLCRVGKYRQAIRQFERIQQLDPAFEAAYCNRIIAYTELNEHESAEEMFYLARLCKEHCPHCYYNIGCSLNARGLYDKAIYCWQRTLELEESHSEVRLRIAEAFRQKGRLEQSRRYYLQALRQQPGNVQTLLELSDLLLEMNRLEEAADKIRRALELSPKQPVAYLQQGRLLTRLGCYEEAVNAFDRVLALDSRFPSAHLRLAETYRLQNNIEKVRWHLRRELLLRPDDPSLLLELGNMLLDCRDQRSAIACFKLLTQVDPENSRGWQNMAIAQFALGRINDGIISCHESLKRNPRSASACFNLALAYERMNEYEQAILWARKALSISPADRGAARLLFRIRVLRVFGVVKRSVSR
ncbi:MAG TPA: tetratricopeptide repeat protein [Tepidisphaeraceae bacterium]|jgi:tetratricopeptide (TPR) repeat protein